MTLLAGFTALLHRHSGQDDLCVGTPVAGRTRLETEPLIGFFVNTLVLRTDLAGQPSFRQLLARVRRAALAAYAHQDLPFEKLVGELAPRRDLSRQPLVQVIFALQNAPMPELAAPGLTLAPLAVDTATAKFDLGLTVVPGAGDLQAIFEYATDLFDDDRIERMAGHLRNLLEAAAADPDAPISRLPMLGETERRQVLVEWSGGRALRPAGPCLHDLFAAQAARRPDAVALACGGDALTYAELDRRSDAVARRLRAARRRAGDAGRPVRRALARPGRRHARHPEGRRRLRPARSGLSARAARLHGRGLGRADGPDPARTARPATRQRARA